MASKKAQEFPVKVTKGTGKDKVTRTAHSPIALVQLKTDGFTVEGEKAPAQAQAPASQKAADKSADSK